VDSGEARFPVDGGLANSFGAGGNFMCGGNGLERST
jgi:hypothetical protein